MEQKPYLGLIIRRKNGLTLVQQRTEEELRKDIDGAIKL